MNSHDKTSKQIRLLTLTGVFTALIYVLTAFVHIPTGTGYIHAGDGMIYMAASLLPTPYAVFAAAVGGALSDGLSGYFIWVPGTLIIKAVTALFFSNKSEKIVTTRNIIGIIPSLFTCVLGYALYEGTVMAAVGDGISKAAFLAPFAKIPENCVQVAGSAALYIFVGLAFDKANIKKKFFGSYAQTKKKAVTA